MRGAIHLDYDFKTSIQKDFCQNEKGSRGAIKELPRHL